MNKYYKLTNLLVLIALVFGSFFVWMEKTVSQTPNLKIVTAEGNAEHLKAIELYGYLSSQNLYGNDESFHLEENQTEYLSNQTLLKQLDHSLDPLMNQLISDHRSFMRGKYQSSKNYISTDDFIVYVAKKTDTYWDETTMDELVIAVLDKETEEEKEFVLPINDPDSYYDLYTSHLNYPKVSVVLSEYTANDQRKHAIYEFDIENPDGGLTEVYDFTDKIKNDESHGVEEVFDKTSRFIPFRTTRYVSNAEVEMMTELVSRFVYDIEENKVIDIPLFDTDTLLLTDQDKIYVAEVLGDQLDFYEMDPTTEKLDAMGEVQLDSIFIREDDNSSYNYSFNQNIAAFDGKLYYFHQKNVKGSYLPVFQIIDLTTQETLFSGRIDRLDDSSNEEINIGITNYRFNSIVN